MPKPNVLGKYGFMFFSFSLLILRREFSWVIRIDKRISILFNILWDFGSTTTYKLAGKFSVIWAAIYLHSIFIVIKEKTVTRRSNFYYNLHFFNISQKNWALFVDYIPTNSAQFLIWIIFIYVIAKCMVSVTQTLVI